MFTIRKSTEQDIPFIEQHAYRLLEFGPPGWRDNATGQMTTADINHNIAAIRSKDSRSAHFVAVDENGDRCGFLQLSTQTDYYTGEEHAHVTDIVVIKSAEGRGLGKLLLQKADEWAREQKLRWITLNVFVNNTHAQQIYEKAGYQKEWIKYLKQL